MKATRAVGLALLLKFVGGMAEAQTGKWVLLIHGGAGDIRGEHFTPQYEKKVREELTAALRVGTTILASGGSALDAVEATVRYLEDSPYFNAGRGSVLNISGTIEMDASIMDGATLKAGAVAAVSTVKNPVALARAVMERTPHVLIVGQYADALACKLNIETAPPSYFITEQRLEQFLKKISAEDGGTVGAVALDIKGNVAAGTSTGGLFMKMQGRVGDSPIIGAGTYADNDCGAVSATGQGEYFMRVVAAYAVCTQMRAGASPLQAGEQVLSRIDSLGGKGGFIIVRRDGEWAFVMNTSGMYRGVATSAGLQKVLIFADEK